MPLACLCIDRPDRGSAIRSTGERAVRLNRGRPARLQQPARRGGGLDANVTKREDLGPRSRPHAANVTKREVFSAGTEPREGCLQQKPRIRIGGGARGPLSRRSGAEIFAFCYICIRAEPPGLKIFAFYYICISGERDGAC